MSTAIDYDLTPTETDRHAILRCEAALRVAAAALCQATSDAVEATTAPVCDVSERDSQMFESLVAEIATEFDLDAEIRQRSGASSVRFTRPVVDSAPNAQGSSLRSVLARLIGA